MALHYDFSDANPKNTMLALRILGSSIFTTLLIVGLFASPFAVFGRDPFFTVAAFTFIFACPLTLFGLPLACWLSRNSLAVMFLTGSVGGFFSPLVVLMLALSHDRHAPSTLQALTAGIPTATTGSIAGCFATVTFMNVFQFLSRRF